MALSTPLAPPTAARTIADPAYVVTNTSPGYCVRSRALDLSSAEGVAVTLVHSPYALAKLADGRFLATRAARESEDGFVELGLSHTSSSADVCHWVKVSAGETLSSLVVDTITHLWLRFFNGPAETARGSCTTHEPDGGSVELGIRHEEWLEEASWRAPLGLLTHKCRHDGGAEGLGASVAPVSELILLVGMVEKGARQWDATEAGPFLEAALGSRPEGKLATTSAVVRLNSKVELSARRRKAFAVAVETGGVPVSELPAEDKGVLVRDHLIPSNTPNHTPQRGNTRPPSSSGGAGCEARPGARE
ncbi:MAG: hypothetical protein SGPRY_012701, partial [Prymnesium sp.]